MQNASHVTCNNPYVSWILHRPSAMVRQGLTIGCAQWAHYDTPVLRFWNVMSKQSYYTLHVSSLVMCYTICVS